MNEGRKRDEPIVPMKGVNKDQAKVGPAESVEGRGSTKRKKQQLNMGQTQGWETMQNKLMVLHQ